jgi:hypothetical protein
MALLAEPSAYARFLFSQFLRAPFSESRLHGRCGILRQGAAPRRSLPQSAAGEDHPAPGG